MAGRIGFGTSAVLRTGRGEAFRYSAPPGLDRGALWLAAGVPALAILILLCARLG